MRVEISKHIVADSEICHGKPTFKGTRVMVSDVVELIGAGISPEKIIKDYYPSLNKALIKEAMEYAARSVSGENNVLVAIPRYGD